MSHFFLAHASHADWRRSLDVCLGEVERQRMRLALPAADLVPTLGWCYITEHYADAAGDLFTLLQNFWPHVQWIGGTGIGIGADATEYIDEPAMAIMLSTLPQQSFRVFASTGEMERLTDDFEAFTAMIHASGEADTQDAIRLVADQTSTGYLFGGLASGRKRALHFANGVIASGISGVAFGPEVGLQSRVTQGCLPIGPTRRVTRGEDNYMYTLDDRTALSCVLHDLNLPETTTEEELLPELGRTLVGLVSSSEDVATRPGQFGTDTEVRHIVGVGLDNGVIAVAEQIETGMRATFCTRNAEAAKQDLQRIIAELKPGSRERISGAVYVSCSGRGGPHFGKPHAEFAMLKEALGPVPVIGFFAAGEVARDHLYGYTGVLTVFTEPSQA